MSKDTITKRLTGGSAAERGLDFQARVSAIVMASLLAERPIGWLEGVLDDTPKDLQAETGGPGDDVSFSTINSEQVELQAKRGLQRGSDLWDALMDLAKGISDGTIDAGVLAVCPNSSGTIREALAEDIVRLGAGRTDGLRDIGGAWAEMLSSSCLDVARVCKSLRIVVVSAVDGNREAEVTACERLARIIQEPAGTWPLLVEYGRRLICRRERSTPEDIYRTLSLAQVKLTVTDIKTRIQLVSAMREWLQRTYANITILGVNGEVAFDGCWLGLHARAMDDASPPPEDLDNALRHYHDYGRSHTDGPSFDSHTIARFVRNCVVIGGPGMGKSTLLKKLALDYSADGFLTLLVRLPQVITLLLREGRRFEEILMDVALSGSGLRTSIVSLDGAVILCDALDECGNQQPLVTAHLKAFSVAHPRARIVVTSRPIGYRSGELVGWRHYELQALSDSAAENAIARVLTAIPFSDEVQRSRALERAIAQLGAKSLAGAAARSPLMITLVAALCSKGIDPGLGKGSLYRNLFQLLQDHPPPRFSERPPNEPERNRFLEFLGWCLLTHGNEPADLTISRCVRFWSEESGQSTLISEAKISDCLHYWECLGVVERVRTHTEEAITFVHKTFGEYAAARHISKSAPNAQREILAGAIGKPNWKEVLSFASHLGLTPLILQIWTELVEIGDAKAGARLDDAVELVVQAGMPLASDVIATFVECCWRAVGDSKSRVRYVAGDALCQVAYAHWNSIKDETIALLKSGDNWSRVVAWACLCVSEEQRLAISALTEALPTLADSRPNDSHLGGFSLQATGNSVWQHLVRGAAKRVLVASPDPTAVQVLREFIGDSKGLSVGTICELETLFKQAGLAAGRVSSKPWMQEWARLMPEREAWNREAAYLLELIDDPLVQIDENKSSNRVYNLELSACLTVISYWETPIGDYPSATASTLADASRRVVIHALARHAGIDHTELVRQARLMKGKVERDANNDALGLFDLPKVDAIAALDRPLATSEFMFELEELILGPSDLFALSAAQMLYSMRSCSEYTDTVKALLTRGRGDALRLSAALASHLPVEVGQRLLLNRLIDGESTSGCSYLYRDLTGPYGADHLAAVRKGLGGNSAHAAKAAAELLIEFRLDAALAAELHAFFDQWRGKEKPYPKSGAVPESPRDELAKILVPVLAHDHDFLLELLADDRPSVQSAAREHALAEAASSALLRLKVLQGVQNKQLQPGLLRTAVSKGFYLAEEAVSVARLLHSEDARIRFAAMPILNIKYLQLDMVRNESTRLLSDVELDIRESAAGALRALAP